MYYVNYKGDFESVDNIESITSYMRLRWYAYVSALHFAFAAFALAKTITYGSLTDLKSTLLIEVTTNPFSKHK